MREINSMNRGMTWPQTGATHKHVELELLDIGRAGVGILLCSIVRILEVDVPLEMRKVRESDPLLRSGWLSSSSTTTPHRNIAIYVHDITI